MIFRIYVNYKPGILDPEAEAIKKTIMNMGHKSVKEIIKGKFFDIRVKDDKDYLSEIEKISKISLSNPVIENFKVIKIKVKLVSRKINIFIIKFPGSNCG